MNTSPTNLYVVVPCYNEEAVLKETASRLLRLFASMAEENLICPQSRIIFVDDGSADATWEIIAGLSAEHQAIGGVKLTHNAGHQSALLAGLMSVRGMCDCAVSIDADLQDDIDAIRQMVIRFQDGYDIVYGVRSERTTDTFFKRSTAQGFYKLTRLLGINLVYNHADYRLMSSRALDALSQFDEVNLFLRGIVPLLGFRHCCVSYARAERFAGESKYPLKKMLSFAFDGITSFTVSPIRAITALGGLSCLAAIVVGIYTLVQKILGHTVGGWASIMMSIWFIGGLQLMSLGLIGEYIGKIYKEVKHRPKYIIEEVRINEL